MAAFRLRGLSIVQRGASPLCYPETNPRPPRARGRTSRRARTIRSTNKLLGTRVDVLAGKTGYIDLAGYCLATLVQLDDERAVSIVVLGASSNSGRFAEARRLAPWLSTQASVLLTSAAE